MLGRWRVRYRSNVLFVWLDGVTGNVKSPWLSMAFSCPLSDKSFSRMFPSFSGYSEDET
jgi:hypothetical protein